MRLLSAILLSGAALSSLVPTIAWASCAEDLTRIQTALPRAAPDVQTRIEPLVTEAEAKLKARDAAGCDAAAAQVLQLLQLPALPPRQLSTPMAGPQEPARANKPSEPAASTQRASNDPRSGPNASANAAPRPPEHRPRERRRPGPSRRRDGAQSLANVQVSALNPCRPAGPGKRRRPNLNPKDLAGRFRPTPSLWLRRRLPSPGHRQLLARRTRHTSCRRATSSAARWSILRIRAALWAGSPISSSIKLQGERPM
jgi:hypothetical protein